MCPGWGCSAYHMLVRFGIGVLKASDMEELDIVVSPGLVLCETAT